MAVLIQKFLYFIIILDTQSYFTDDFNSWLFDFYGSDVQHILNRADLGHFGSFGGKSHRLERLNNQPVVFVHGVSSQAHDSPLVQANHFASMGYRWSELYATTYANGAQGNPLQWANYSMRCLYVKQVRALIIAVRLYTGRIVDVIPFSLGVPITRKAVMGGYCVDTGEYLGSPLTRIVDTFVGIAGPNHGISLQIGALSVPGCPLSILPICNQLNGLYSGACPTESKFLQDINSKFSYEGRNIFSIYSESDQIIGYVICNKVIMHAILPLSLLLLSLRTASFVLQDLPLLREYTEQLNMRNKKENAELPLSQIELVILPVISRYDIDKAAAIVKRLEHTIEAT